MAEKPTEKTRFRASEVLPLAELVRDRLLCGHGGSGRNVRCEIAGSLRRGAAGAETGRDFSVGDVEIVLEPAFGADLFGGPLPTSPALDFALQGCLNAGLLAWDTDTPRNGPRYKRLRLPALGLPLDLFLTGRDNYGNILAIRTGDADFSRLLVTRRAKGGLLPNWMRHGGGCLYARAEGYPDFEEEPEPNDYWENVLPCPTEQAFFRRLWLDVPPMSLRNAAGARALSVQAVRNQHAARTHDRPAVPEGDPLCH